MIYVCFVYILYLCNIQDLKVHLSEDEVNFLMNEVNTMYRNQVHLDDYIEVTN